MSKFLSKIGVSRLWAEIKKYCSNFVTINTEQVIREIKNFTKGIISQTIIISKEDDLTFSSNASLRKDDDGNFIISNKHDRSSEIILGDDKFQHFGSDGTYDILTKKDIVTIWLQGGINVFTTNTELVLVDSLLSGSNISTIADAFTALYDAIINNKIINFYFVTNVLVKRGVLVKPIWAEANSSSSVNIGLIKVSGSGICQYLVINITNTSMKINIVTNLEWNK